MFELNSQIVVGNGQNSKSFAIDLFLGIPFLPFLVLGEQSCQKLVLQQND